MSNYMHVDYFLYMPYVRGSGSMETSRNFRCTSRLIIAIVVLCCTGQKTTTNAACDLISTCYRCVLPSSEVETSTYVNTVDDCLALLNSSTLYRTATYSAFTGQCNRSSTDQHLLSYGYTTLMTFRKTCNTDCLTYVWGYADNTALFNAPSIQTNESRSMCLASCAETANCRMLHHTIDDTCGLNTDCGTACSTKSSFNSKLSTRWCYTGLDCGLAAPVSNGWIYYSATQPTDQGTMVSYDCSTGYTKANSNMRTCMANGMWSTEVFTCNPKDCGGLSDTDGAWSYITTTYGSNATLTCNTGYEIRSSWNSLTYGSTQTVTCMCCSSSMAYWYRGYYCSIVDCGLPTPVIDGSVSYTTTTYGSAAVYTCDVGYNLTGDSVILCNASGQWDKPEPTCNAVDCGPPSTPLNGSVHAPLTTYGATATFTCDAGFDLNGTAMLECNAFGMWNDVEPTCEPRVSLPCHVQWASPVSRHYHIQTTTHPDYTLITTTPSPSDIHCVTMCNAHARANCVSGNGCRLVMYDRLTKECSGYYIDTISGITVGCDATRICYYQ